MSKIVFSKKLSKGLFTVYNDRPDLENIIQVDQIHSAKLAEYVDTSLDMKKVDGIIICNENLKKNYNFAIKTADCIPAIIIGNEGVAIIHAGWRGIKDQILAQPEIKKIDPYYCFLGPSIQLESFEVQEEFYEHFGHGPNFHSIKEKLYFDLQSEATQQVKSLCKEIEVENSFECTYKQSKYNSYRRDKTSTRNWNIFSL